MSVLQRAALAGGLVAWLVAIAAGSKFMLDHEFGPGTPSGSPSVWPHGSSVARSSELPTLVLFAHPRCPCTRATIAELASLMTQCEGRLAAHVSFYRPKDAGADWYETDLWRSAALIPGVRVASDPDGAETERFGATTSGHAALYDPRGNLLYSGGITSSRGHAGENLGRLTVRDLVLGRDGPRTTLPVFGCALRAPGDHAGGCRIFDPPRGSYDGGTL